MHAGLLAKNHDQTPAIPPVWDMGLETDCCTNERCHHPGRPHAVALGCATPKKEQTTKGKETYMTKHWSIALLHHTMDTQEVKSQNLTRFEVIHQQIAAFTILANCLPM